MLLRQALGATLRAVRTQQQQTLREVAAASAVSLGYLSEVERGCKEPSSEVLAAVCAALDVSVHAVVVDAGRALAGVRRRATLMTSVAAALEASRGAAGPAGPTPDEPAGQAA